MLSVWMNKIQNRSILILILFVALFLVTRVPRLWNDTINPDAVNWHYRTEQFVNGLKYQQWDKTYQHYHPGVTMMWITGAATELFKQLTDIKTYSIYSFPAFDFISKFAIVIAQLIVSLYIIFILRKYFSIWGATLMMTMLSLEPFFLGNSRLYHMDILFALLTFAALLTGYLAVERQSNWYYAATGVLLGLSVLTKSIGVLALAFYLGWFVLVGIFKTRKITEPLIILPKLLITISLFLITVTLLFPALWINPVYYIGEVFNESERIGLRRGHDQVVFGENTNEASFWFYFLVIILKSSPFLLAGLFIFFFYYYRLKNKYLEQINGGFLLYLGTFVIFYILVMSMASKKIDRYVTLIYPMLTVFSYYGYLALAKIKNTKSLIILIFLVFVIYPILSQFPYYFTYTNPLLGTSADANRIVGQKPFGIGMYDLKSHIMQKYGEKTLGLLDPKPMKTIYGNSKVLDIRVSGAGDYELLILGINEEMPENLLNDEIKWIQRSSININGLEYWKVYEKQR